MKIGIDIDNVISNFDDILLNEYLLHDKKLRNSGIINKDADYIRKGMFDWSDNKGYSKLLIVKVDKQLITKIIITYFSKILNRFKEF